MTFEPNEHLRTFSRRQRQLDGSYKQVSVAYMDVQWRVVWFREEHPNGSIVTEMLSDPTSEVAIVRAVVTTEDGVTVTGHGRVPVEKWEENLEKAETRAVGRALALLGYGTQFAGGELDDASVADSPTEQAPRRGGARKPADPKVPAKTGDVELDARLSEEAAKHLFEMAETAGIKRGEFDGILKGRYAVTRMGEMTVGQGRDLDEYLQKRIGGASA